MTRGLIAITGPGVVQQIRCWGNVILYIPNGRVRGIGQNILF